MLGWPPATPRTSSAGPASCWPCCAKASASMNPRSAAISARAKSRTDLSAQRRQVEHRAGGVGGRREPPVWRVLGGSHDAAAEFGDHLQRLVHVVGTEKNRPI